MVGTSGSTTDDHNWWLKKSCNRFGCTYTFTHSWSFAGDQRQFQLYHIPGGYIGGTYTGDSLLADPNATTGDEFVYDWENDGDWDHLSIDVGFGTGSDGYYGAYVDYHSFNRYHIFWTGRTYNIHIQTTTIESVRIFYTN